MRGNALVFEKHLSKMPREPALRNTCRGPRTSLPHCAFRVGRRRGRPPSSARQSLRTLVMEFSATAPGAQSPWDSVMGAIEDSISQCTFLQMTYTTENPHADGSATPGARPRHRPSRHRDRHNDHATSPAPTTTGWQEDRCPVVSKRPLHSCSAAKMSTRICIGPEPVLASHAQSPTVAGSHCPAIEDSAPNC
jgi:hypothetical protein